MIIDCHTHLNRYDPTGPETLEGRYAALRAEMGRHGVAYALVLTSYKVNDDRSGLHETLELVGDDPAIGVVAGVPYLEYRARDLAELRTLLQQGRIRGLKLYPGYEPFYPSDPRLRVVYEMAGEANVPVMIHTGDTFDRHARVRYAHPLHVDDVAVDFREVNFVLCHLGNPWMADAMEVIYKNENVFADISGLTVGAFEERFERHIVRQVNGVIAYVNDGSKLLYGTDWPISDMGSYLRFVDKLELRDEERSLLMGGNAARLFRVDPEAGEGNRSLQPRER